MTPSGKTGRLLSTLVLAALATGPFGAWVAASEGVGANRDGGPPLVLEEDHKIMSSDGSVTSNFGRAVSVAADIAAVGSVWESPGRSLFGEARVFRESGGVWIEEQRLLPSDGPTSAYFGMAISASGDAVLVGEKDFISIPGSAYLYRFNGGTWDEEVKLTASDGAAGDNFAFSVSLSGDRAADGAITDTHLGIRSGSVYVYRHDAGSWVEEAKLVASDRAGGDMFGSVSIDGTVILVGATGDAGAGPNTGASYVFRYDGSAWQEEAKLLASDGAMQDYFGASVSVSGDVAVIGADSDDDRGLESGSAYVFRYDGSSWVEEAKLLASDGSAGDHFADAVSVSGDVVVAGADHDDDRGQDSGSAYLFRYDGAAWIEEAKLLATDGQQGDILGDAVSVSAQSALVGAWVHDDYGHDSWFSGSAYIYDLSGGVVDLTLDRIGGLEVSPGQSLNFEAGVQNRTGNVVSGDIWLSVLPLGGAEFLVPPGLLNQPNPLSGQVGPFGSVQIWESLAIPVGAPLGWYTLVGRIGTYPASIRDVSSYPFLVTTGEYGAP